MSLNKTVAISATGPTQDGRPSTKMIVRNTLHGNFLTFLLLLLSLELQLPAFADPNLLVLSFLPS
jgi:hypothetical protein